MWRTLLDDLDWPLEAVMAALGIPLWDKELGRRAAEALEAALEGRPPRGDLPGEVRARVEGLAELLLALGADEAFRRWMDAYHAERRVLGLEGEGPGEDGVGPGAGEEPPGRGPGGR